MITPKINLDSIDFSLDSSVIESENSIANFEKEINQKIISFKSKYHNKI